MNEQLKEKAIDVMIANINTLKIRFVNKSNSIVLPTKFKDFEQTFDECSDEKVFKSLIENHSASIEKDVNHYYQVNF